MAFQKKYYWQFIDLKQGRTHVMEIWQNTGDVLVAEEITGAPNSFVRELPELEHKFQVVRGSGCSISLLSNTDMKFYNGLYHVDPQEFMYEHYIDGTLENVGYLNSEMYRERYDIDFNYIIQTTGNDGFALMDRFSFLQVSEAQYTGVKSKWELLQIILDKIALPWVEIRISLATTFADFSAAANSTILHESYVDCANFYDEDEKPMSLREVLESILAPYGAFIRSEGGNIYITDIHTMAGGGTVTYQRFNASTYAYIADVGISNEKAISTITYMGTGQNIELSGGVNRQIVAYSPYTQKKVLENALVGTVEFSGIPATWSTKSGYYYKTLTGNDQLNSYSPADFEASYFTNEQDANIYLRIPYSASNTKVMDLNFAKWINISGAKTSDAFSTYSGRTRHYYYQGAAFKITGDVLAKSKSNPYDSSIIGTDTIGITLKAKLYVGGKYFNGTQFTTTNTTFNIQCYTNTYGLINDSFVPIGKNGSGLIAIIGNLTTDIILSGDFYFEIWSDYDIQYADTSLDGDDSLIDEAWLKNIGIEVVFLDGTEIPDSDIEYIGLLDKLFQNEGQKITLTCGTDAYYADKGKILWYDGSDYRSIETWTRNGQTFNIEKLLLGSLSSNLRSGYVTLDNMTLKNNFSLMNVLTDTYISGKKLMAKNAKINYHDDYIECTLVEISTDELIIVEDETVR